MGAKLPNRYSLSLFQGPSAPTDSSAFLRFYTSNNQTSLLCFQLLEASLQIPVYIGKFGAKIPFESCQMILQISVMSFRLLLDFRF